MTMKFRSQCSTSKCSSVKNNIFTKNGTLQKSTLSWLKTQFNSYTQKDKIKKKKVSSEGEKWNSRLSEQNSLDIKLQMLLLLL